MTGEISSGSVLYWFRRDLRLEDNEALCAAAGLGLPLFAVFVIEAEHRARAASFWWLCRSLERLSAELAERGLGLRVLEGDPLEILPRLAEDADIRHAAWNRVHEPAEIEREAQLRKKLHARNIAVFAGEGQLLFRPDEILNKSGQPFRVFTPFWKHCLGRLPKPERRRAPPLIGSASWPDWVEGRAIDPASLARFAWAKPFSEHWTPGEAGALARLRRFLAARIDAYGQDRDRPDIEGTSRLSAHLHWGEIAPSRILAEIDKTLTKRKAAAQGIDKFLSELGWREFAHHLLAQFPRMDRQEFKSEFRSHPWRRDEAVMEAWRKGRTGIPIVDAGMRELWATGWMHNRVRMVAASFLVKQLRQDWRLGLAWFDDTLVDADLANNAAGWQWVAGTGADASPYFRIFNPVLQGRKFDPHGIYVRRWLPELSGLDDADIHAPWLADGAARRRYPPPLVDLGQARKEALAARQGHPALPSG